MADDESLLLERGTKSIESEGNSPSADDEPVRLAEVCGDDCEPSPQFESALRDGEVNIQDVSCMLFKEWRDADPSLHSDAVLNELIRKEETVQHMKVASDIFGITGANSITRSLISQHELGAPRLVSLPAPKVPLPPEEKNRDVWLVDMPKIHPARQVLHFDSVPYDPMTLERPKTTDKDLFTATNVIRWGHNKSKSQFVSNSRIVKWSDGSVTLHVGSDTFEMRPNTDDVLTFVAEPKETEVNGELTTCYVSSMPIKQHVSLFLAQDAPNSVDDFVRQQAHLTANSAAKKSGSAIQMSAEAGLGLTGAHLPQFDPKDPRPVASLSAAEQHFATRLRDRERQAALAQKSGRRMGLADMLNADFDALEDLQSAQLAGTLDEMVAQQTQMQSQSQRQAVASRRSRFEQMLELRTGDLGGSTAEIVSDRETPMPGKRARELEGEMEELRERDRILTDIQRQAKMTGPLGDSARAALSALDTDFVPLQTARDEHAKLKAMEGAQ